MKRLIYSLYKEDVDEHQSCGDYKRSQFKKYRNQLEETQRKYAETCGAEYKLIDPTNTNYNKIQLEKLFLLEEFSQSYDEVLYLDFDVVPVTKQSFFETFDLNFLCFHEVVKNMASIQYEDQEHKIQNETITSGYYKKKFHKKLANIMVWYTAMTPFTKMAAKNSMLMLDDIIGRETIINTGVVGGNKKSIGLLKLKERIEMLDKKLEEAKEDSLYPESISELFFQNNETYMSYLVERFDLPYQEIGTQWNYVLYKESDSPNSNNHFLHYISKDFHCCFDS